MSTTEDDGKQDSFDVAEPTSENGPMTTLSFTGTSAEFLNPERGYYVGHDLLDGDPARVLDDGYTLALSIVRLDAYRVLPLGKPFLKRLQAGLDRVRTSGIKVILRFTYNSDFAADASRNRMLGHIEQLRPLLQANADVISILQAGFIGAWGEWHGSTHGLDNPSDRGAILRALLAALPTSRSVQVRTPMYKDQVFPGGPLTEEEGFTKSERARVGHHNDCFLASESDLGTYDHPVVDWMAFVADDGRYTPIGGETCSVNAPRTDCEEALAEMEANHWSYLNREYNQEVLSAWDEQGCDAEIRRRLGYRFAMTRAAVTEAVKPGGIVDLQVEIKNHGFAVPFNERPVFAVLRHEQRREVVRLSEVDPRRWTPGQATTFTTSLRLPADLTPGSYELALWLPDEAEALRTIPHYAIRFATKGVWDGAVGDNVITRELIVDPAAPGTADPASAGLAEIR